MSTRLTCGIATKITVIKDGDSRKNILKDLERQFDLDIYNITEDERNVILNIKEKIFEDNAVAFVKEQLEIFTNYSLSWNKRLSELDKLENKSYDELIEIAKNSECVCFQFMEGCFVNNNVNYLIEGHTAYVDVVGYISAGKVFMECWNDIFYYLRNAIIKSSNNPIKTATVITITG